MRKKLGFRTAKSRTYPRYIFVGSEEMTLACQQLAADNALTAEYRIAEADELMKIHDEILQQIGRQSKTLLCGLRHPVAFRYQRHLKRLRTAAHRQCTHRILPSKRQ